HPSRVEYEPGRAAAAHAPAARGRARPQCLLVGGANAARRRAHPQYAGDLGRHQRHGALGWRPQPAAGALGMAQGAAEQQQPRRLRRRKEMAMEGENRNFSAPGTTPAPATDDTGIGLLLDLDGTLIDAFATPEEARAPAETLELLAGLHEKTEGACVI